MSTLRWLVLFFAIVHALLTGNPTQVGAEGAFPDPPGPTDSSAPHVSDPASHVPPSHGLAVQPQSNVTGRWTSRYQGSTASYIGDPVVPADDGGTFVVRQPLTHRPPRVTSILRSHSLLRLAATCVVRSAADSGAGTLRACLGAARPGDTITFDPSVFPPDSSTVIELEGELPYITANNLVVDGRGAGVVIDGGKFSPGTTGIDAGLVVIRSSGVVIQGMSFRRLDAGIGIGAGATGAQIGASEAHDPTRSSINVYDCATGILIQDRGTSGNVIRNSNLSNNNYGIRIVSGPSDNTIGGSRLDGNIIALNKSAAISIRDAGTDRNVVSGNLIGVNHDGSMAQPNGAGVLIHSGASQNVIGGASREFGNVISGNNDSAVSIYRSSNNLDSMENRVSGNMIGLDAQGQSAIPNRLGVIVHNVSGTVIGDSEAPNVISGNTLQAVEVAFEQGAHSKIASNFVGTDSSGSKPIPNGVGIILSRGSHHNTVGGTTPSERNIISGNRTYGILIHEGSHDNLVLGNFVGLDTQGQRAVSNGLSGIASDNASANVIGSGDGGANVISGNLGHGVVLEGEDADRSGGNIINQNIIGLTSNGRIAMGNEECGVVIASRNNVINKNTVTGNSMCGIQIRCSCSSSNSITANIIGLDTAATSSIGNGGPAMQLELGAHSNTIGGTDISQANTMVGNQGGVHLLGNGIGNRFTRNRIYANHGLPAIEVREGGTAFVDAPLLTEISGTGMLRGRACAGCEVEIFANGSSRQDLQTFVGSTTASGSGAFGFQLNTQSSGKFLAAIAHNADGSTSEPSNVLRGLGQTTLLLPLAWTTSW